MKRLAEIVALYEEIDAALDRERQLAATSGASVVRIEAKQLLNDQAYFILAWGQFEAEVDERCRSAIRARLGKTDWALRRAWDLYNPDDRRLSGLGFEDRVALILDRMQGPGSAWSKVMTHYAIRNQIAHGTLRSERVDVSAVARDFWSVQSQLAP